MKNAVHHARVINYISSADRNASNSLKLQNLFFQGVRKGAFTKRNVKSLTIDEQLIVLEALPPIEGDGGIASKSLHYSLLNDMLTQSQ